MKIQKISDSGIIFTLDDSSYSEYYWPANIYASIGKKHIFLSDGYFGPEILEKVVSYLEKEFGKKKYILFNSHSHKGHLRGNSFFEDTIIISHKLTKELIIVNNKEKSKLSNEVLQRKIAVPNFTFDKECTEYKKEGILFFHSPGHTEDSSACYDFKNNVLFAADNVEYPFPYVTSSDVSTYISTLKKYLEYPSEIVIPSHGYATNKDLIESNIRYLESLPDVNTNMYTDDTKEAFYFATIKNLSTIGDDYFIKGEFHKAKIFLEKTVEINQEGAVLSKEALQNIESKIKQIEDSK